MWSEIGRSLGAGGDLIINSYDKIQDDRFNKKKRDLELEDMIQRRLESQDANFRAQQEEARRQRDYAEKERVRKAQEELRNKENEYNRKRIEQIEKQAFKSAEKATELNKKADVYTEKTAQTLNVARQLQGIPTQENSVQEINVQGGWGDINNQIDSAVQDSTQRMNQYKMNDVNELENQPLEEQTFEPWDMKRRLNEAYRTGAIDLKEYQDNMLNLQDREPGGRYSQKAMTQSYRDLIIPDNAVNAFDRTAQWFNRIRKQDPSMTPQDLIERFTQEMVEDGLTRQEARSIANQNSSRINQIYATGIQNPWKGTSAAVDAAQAATQAREQGIQIPGTNMAKAGTAWSPETTKNIQNIVSDVKTQYKFADKMEQIANAKKVIETQDLAKQAPAALAASITAVARQMAPGVVTDRDFQVLTDYGAPVGVRTWDAFSKWITGQPPDKKVEVIGMISKVLESAAQRSASDVLNTAYETVNATGLNVDRNRLWNFIAPSTSRKMLNMSQYPTNGTNNPAKFDKTQARRKYNY